MPFFVFLENSINLFKISIMKKIPLFLAAISSIFLVSCRAYYVPNENSTPMLSHKNDLMLTGSTSLGMRAATLAGSIAYSPIINLGLVYQGSGYTNGGGGYNSNAGRFHEFSAGYYKLKENNTLFEVYLNHGIGNTNNSYAETSYTQIGTYQTKFNKTSMNFAIGKVDENFSYSFFTRIGSLNIYDLTYDNNLPIYGNVYQDLVDIKNKRYFTFIEPGFTSKFGFDGFKLYTKGSFSIIDQNFSSLNYQQFQLTFGLQLELNKLIKK